MYDVTGRDDLLLDVTAPVGYAQPIVAYLTLYGGIYVVSRLIGDAWRSRRAPGQVRDVM